MRSFKTGLKPLTRCEPMLYSMRCNLWLQQSAHKPYVRKHLKYNYALAKLPRRFKADSIERLHKAIYKGDYSEERYQSVRPGRYPQMRFKNDRVDRSEVYYVIGSSSEPV